MNKLKYTELLKTKDLFDMYEGMTGDWLTDKKGFIKQQEALESFTENIEVIDEEFIN
jgi:hypothetical protein